MNRNSIIDEIYETRIVRDAAGNEYDLSSAIDSAEGDSLLSTDLIR